MKRLSRERHDELYMEQWAKYGFSEEDVIRMVRTGEIHHRIVQTGILDWYVGNKRCFRESRHYDTEKKTLENGSTRCSIYITSIKFIDFVREGKIL